MTGRRVLHLSWLKSARCSIYVCVEISKRWLTSFKPSSKEKHSEITWVRWICHNGSLASSAPGCTWLHNIPKVSSSSIEDERISSIEALLPCQDPKPIPLVPRRRPITRRLIRYPAFRISFYCQQLHSSAPFRARFEKLKHSASAPNTYRCTQKPKGRLRRRKTSYDMVQSSGLPDKCPLTDQEQIIPQPLLPSSCFSLPYHFICPVGIHLGKDPACINILLEIRVLQSTIV